MTSPNPLNGSATVSPTAPQIPPARAVWTVNAEAKNATAEVLGGTATIYRSPKDDKFRCDFKRPLPIETEDSDGGDGSINLSIPLHDCPNLVAAQVRAEMMIRESLSKTHPEVLTEATAAEQAETIASAPEDPF